MTFKKESIIYFAPIKLLELGCIHNSINIVTFLLDKVPFGQCTLDECLVYAVRSDAIKIAKLLLENGACPIAKTQVSSITALEIENQKHQFRSRIRNNYRKCELREILEDYSINALLENRDQRDEINNRNFIWKHRTQ
jgi:hypothetical protein